MWNLHRLSTQAFKVLNIVQIKKVDIIYIWAD